MAFYHHFPTLRTLPLPALQPLQQVDKRTSTTLSLTYLAMTLFLVGLLLLTLLSFQEGFMYVCLALNMAGILVYRDIYNWKRSQESLDVEEGVDA